MYIYIYGAAGGRWPGGRSPAPLPPGGTRPSRTPPPWGERRVCYFFVVFIFNPDFVVNRFVSVAGNQFHHTNGLLLLVRRICVIIFIARRRKNNNARMKPPWRATRRGKPLSINSQTRPLHANEGNQTRKIRLHVRALARNHPEGRMEVARTPSRTVAFDLFVKCQLASRN